MSSEPLVALAKAIAAGERVELTPELARRSSTQGASRQVAKSFFLEELGCYLYEGDTALHIAAAAHAVPVVKKLLALGADVDARNRRGASPLHYAACAGDPKRVAATVALLIAAGADPDAMDKSGVAPLHRAVRNRCAAAVQALLEGGADPRLKNGSGSTPAQLARWTTGKSGSGSPKAREEQAKIVGLLSEHGA